MSGVERTHRDTLALLLTMVGATCWAVVPVGTVMQMLNWTAHSAAALMMAPLALGGLLGAAAAATVWPALSLRTFGVAGALCGGLAMGAFRFTMSGMPTFRAIDVALAGVVAVAAVGGALLGRRRKRAAPGLVAALITTSAYGVAAGAIGMLAALGVEAPALTVVIVLFSPVPFIVLAVYLCREAQPGPMAMWVFMLTLASMAILSIGNGSSRPGEIVAAIVVGGIFAGIAAGGTAFVASAAHHLLPAPRAADPVPPARVH